MMSSAVLPTSHVHRIPALPEIGRSAEEFSRLARHAQASGDTLAFESAKVGLYITLALDSHLSWHDKLRHFEHALRRHCVPPTCPDEDIWLFFRELALLVKRYCGLEALRLASKEDDFYAARLAMGQSRDDIENEAEAFFENLMGGPSSCPPWFIEEDWEQLKLIRDQWI